jgi:hypothetical protein
MNDTFVQSVSNGGNQCNAQAPYRVEPKKFRSCEGQELDFDAPAV